MLDWLGVTFVSKASYECDRVEALHCDRQALEKKRSLTCVMRDHFQSVAQFSQKFHTGLVNWPQRLKCNWLESNCSCLVTGKVVYFAVFLSAAISATLPGESADESTYESANVCTTVTS